MVVRNVKVKFQRSVSESGSRQHLPASLVPDGFVQQEESKDQSWTLAGADLSGPPPLRTSTAEDLHH